MFECKEQDLNLLQVGKKEQYAARIIFFVAGFGYIYMGTNDTYYKGTFTNWR